MSSGGEERSFSPGVELALLGSLLLEDASVFDLHRAGNEADLTALLHQAAYPPVVVEFLHGELERQSLTSSLSAHKGTLGEGPTSLTCRNSLASKEMAMPGTGTSSSWLGL